MKSFARSKVNRIIDANLNRTKEGLRVCEEVVRFVLDDRALTAQFKNLRHDIDRIAKPLVSKKELLKCRSVGSDPGTGITTSRELSRKNIDDIFFSNIQRAKESTRVLEEFLKLKDVRAARGFKAARYELYELEKNTAKMLALLRH